MVRSFLDRTRIGHLSRLTAKKIYLNLNQNLHVRYISDEKSIGKVEHIMAIQISSNSSH